ncbi:MAG: hypothetical protein J5546_10280 [Lachnospiraceae bacterium]|nr:hypothetical protein [Lachnospiraceae bacterium]
MTTAALFVGLTPPFYVRFGLLTNAILITIFSLICAGLLFVTLKESGKHVA